MTGNQTPKPNKTVECFFCGAPLEYHLDECYTLEGERALDHTWHSQGVLSWTDGEGVLCAACATPECHRMAQDIIAEQHRAKRRALMETHDAQTTLAGIPPQYHGATFQDAQPAGARAIQGWFDAECPGLLLLLGKAGLGKTRMLYAIKRAAYVIQRPCRLRSVADTILELQAIARESMRDLQAHILELSNFPGLLLFDDLGTEKVTDYALSMFGLVVTAREEWRRPTGLSSNLTVPGIESAWGSRIASRLSGGTIVRFAGKDRRQSKGGK